MKTFLPPVRFGFGAFQRVSDDAEAEAESHGTLERVKNLFRRGGKTPKRTTGTNRRSAKSKQAEPEPETDRLAADAFVENDSETGSETDFLFVGPSEPVDELYPDSEARITSGRPHEKDRSLRPPGPDLSRQGFMNGDISTVMSPRTVITWAENAEIFTDIGFAFRVTFLNKCDELERPLVAEFYQRCFNAELTESSVNVAMS